MVNMKIAFWALFCLLIAVSQGVPSNDLCPNAIIITDSGAVSSTSSVDVTDATSSATDPVPSCLSSSSSYNRSVWWTFTPSSNDTFTISTCGSDTSTNLPDTVLLLLTGACDAFTKVPRGCSDNACAKQSRFVVSLTANVKYYIVVYSGSSDSPAFGANSVQVKITRGGTFLPAAINDKCEKASSVVLNSITALPLNTYWSDDYTYTQDCYRDTSAKVLGNGGDIVYKFTPPADGNYNFRVISRPGIVAQDVALIMTASCPASGTRLTYPTCYTNGVNRRSDFIEMYNCQPLTLGQPAYIIVDLLDPDTNTLTDTSAQYYLEVSQCNQETDVASPEFAAAVTCGVTGGIDQTISLRNSDYYLLNPDQGSSNSQIEKDAVMFVLVDGGAATVGGFNLALVREDGSEIQTFPADNNPIWGINSSSIVGYRLPETTTYYIRITSEQERDIPYQVYAWWERSFSVPNTESEPNSNIATASNLGQYGIGQLTGTDVDYWKITVPDQSGFASIMTACLAPGTGQTTIPAGLKFVFRNSSGDSILSVEGGSRGRCMNIRPLNSGQFYFSVEASGNGGSYTLGVSYDCAPSNQAGIPSTPIGGVPYSVAPSVNTPRAPLSLILPVAPLGAPTKSVSMAHGLSASYVLVLLSIVLVWLN